MNETSLPCRKCKRVSGDATVIYGRDRTGALVPKAAQCKNRCPRAPQVPVPSGPAAVTAIRPGKCSACTWDIVPGDKIIRGGDGRFWHTECSPAESPPPPRKDRDRRRVTTVQARGVSV